jgi:Protein of unknown function (DUF3108)
MSDLAAISPTNAAPLIKSPAGGADARISLAQGIVARRGLLSTPTRKLTAALIASLLLHVLLGSFAELEPPEEKSVPLVAKFMQLPPPPVPVAAPLIKPKPKTKPKPRLVTAAEASVAVVAPEPVAETVAAPSPAPEPVVAEAKPEPVLEQLTPPPTVEVPPAPPPARMPPKKIDLGYSAFFGEQKFEVGPVTLKFTHDAGRYKLRIIGRGKGIAALLYPGTFTGESEGQITAEGLRPDKFVEERGNPDKRRETIFDHEKRLLRIPERDPIPFEGSPHDPLTWIVQFYFSTPKTDKVTISVGTSRRMDVYTLERAGEEVIDVPTGDADPVTGQRALKKISTQVWKGSRKPDTDGKPNGSATFWLSPEWHYVPFRLKVVNAQGRSASFELTGINAE